MKEWPRGSVLSKRGLVFILGLGAIIGCGSKAPLADKFASLPKPQAPAGYRPSEPSPIEILGENCCITLMPGGKQFLFLSRGRPRHAHFQVYVYDFERKQDRRLSFHDGDDQGVSVQPKSLNLLFASTTDTLKEDPKFLREALGRPSPESPDGGRRPLWSLDNYELYQTKRDGSQMERLTNHPGFDGEAQFHPLHQGYVFTSWRDGRATLLITNERGQNPQVLVRGPGHDGQAQFSPNGKELVFVRYDNDSSQIWWMNLQTKKARALTSDPGIRWTPSWHPDGNTILFSSNYEDAQNFELYAIHKDGSCLRRLTYELGHDLLPVAQTDGKRLLFTSDRSGAHQLYTLDYQPPPCP